MSANPGSSRAQRNYGWLDLRRHCRNVRPRAYRPRAPIARQNCEQTLLGPLDPPESKQGRLSSAYLLADIRKVS